MQVTATLIQYYFFCHRQLWLHANDVRMEDGFHSVEEGNLIQDKSYSQRSSKYEEVQIGPIKIDFFDAKNKIVHEIKKSSKARLTYHWQVKYYIYILEQHGIEGVTGIIEYPKERKKEEILLTEPDRERIKELLVEIPQIFNNDNCPVVLNKPKCKNCSYYDFCYTNE